MLAAVLDVQPADVVAYWRDAGPGLWFAKSPGFDQSGVMSLNTIPGDGKSGTSQMPGPQRSGLLMEAPSGES